MKILTGRAGGKCLSMAITLVSLLVLSLLSVSAAVNVTTKIKHKPIKNFMAEKRIQLQVDVKDPEGIQLVRSYFKAEELSDFVFVPMTQKGRNTFEGILPAPSAMTETIEYLFLVVNNNNQVVKTQVFTAVKNKTSRSAGADAFDGEIKVYSEVESASVPGGFSDSIVVDVVESSARFGIVAEGIYAQPAGASAAAATSAGGAVSAGVVTAGVGISTTAIVAGGVALAGGALAVASSGGDDGGSEDDVTIAGDWEGSWSGEEISGNWEMTVLTDNSFTLAKEYSGDVATFTGTWMVSGSNITATLEENGSSVGTISADISDESLTGTMVLDESMIYTWSGAKKVYGSIDIGW